MCRMGDGCRDAGNACPGARCSPTGAASSGGRKPTGRLRTLGALTVPVRHHVRERELHHVPRRVPRWLGRSLDLNDHREERCVREAAAEPGGLAGASGGLSGQGFLSGQ